MMYVVSADETERVSVRERVDLLEDENRHKHTPHAQIMQTVNSMISCLSYKGRGSRSEGAPRVSQGQARAPRGSALQPSA